MAQEPNHVTISFTVPRNDVGYYLALQALLQRDERKSHSIHPLEIDTAFLQGFPALCDEVARGAALFESFEDQADSSPAVTAFAAYEQQRIAAVMEDINQRK